MSTQERRLKSGNDDSADSARASKTNQRSGADGLISILSKRSVMIGIALVVLVASVASKFLSFFWEVIVDSEAPRKVVEIASSTGDALELFGTALASLLGLILAAKAVKLSEDNERQNSRYQALTSILFDPAYRKWVESKALFARFGSIGVAFENRKELLQMASSQQMNEALFSPCPHSCSDSHASNISVARSGSQLSLKRLVDFLSTGSSDQDLLHVLAADVRSLLLRFEARMDAAWVDRYGDPVVETEVGVADRLANVAFNRVVEASSNEPLESIHLDFIPFQSESRKELVEQLKGSGLNVITASSSLQSLGMDDREQLVEAVESHAATRSPPSPAILVVEAEESMEQGMPSWFVRIPVFEVRGDKRGVDEELLANQLANLLCARLLFVGLKGDGVAPSSEEVHKLQSSSIREEFTEEIICALPCVIQKSGDDDFFGRAAKCADEICAGALSGESADSILSMSNEDKEALLLEVAKQARAVLANSGLLYQAKRAASDLIKQRVLIVFCGSGAAPSAS